MSKYSLGSVSTHESCRKEEKPVAILFERKLCQKWQPAMSVQEQFLGGLTAVLEVCNSLKDSVISLLRDNTLE